MEKSKRVLVLYVDRDADVSRITGESTPIVGRDKNYEVACRFALLSPEDSDVNALFYAIKIYDEIISKQLFEACQIATIAGEPREGLEADMKIKRELEDVLSKFNADGIIFVSDGGRDELVIPLISSVKPLVSIKRVVVGQSESVEETFLVINKYIRRILNEPLLRYLTIGIPGLLLILYVFLSFFNLVHFFYLALLLLIGIVAFVKGFSIDDIIIKNVTNYKLQSLAFMMASIIIILALYNSITYVDDLLSKNQNLSISQILGEFLLAPFAYYFNTISVSMLAILIFLGTRMLELYLNDKPIREELFSIFFVFSIGILLNYVGYVLKNPFISLEIFGINILFIIALLLVINIAIVLIIRLR